MSGLIYSQSIVTIGASATGIQGAVTNQSGGAAVGKGYVQVFNQAGTQILYELPVDPVTGLFSKGDLAAGSYRARYDPPIGMCQGDGEAYDVAFTVTNGQMTVVNFVAQAALIWTENFQGIADSAHITGATSYSHGNIPSGYFGHGDDRDVFISDHTGSEVQLTNNWPDGSKCMQYNFPARNGNLGNYTVQAGARNGAAGTTMPAISTGEICCSWLAQYGDPDFYVGDDSQGGTACEYKATFNDALQGTGGNCGWLLEFDASTNPVQNGKIQLRPQLYDDSGGLSDPHDQNAAKRGTFSSAFSNGNMNGMNGSPHRFALWVTGIDSSTAIMRCYVDGVLAWTSPTRPWHFQVGALATGAYLSWQVGANINNGPSRATKIFIRELSLAQRRSSFRPGSQGYGISE